MRKEKQLLLDEIRSNLQESKGFVITRYQGLNASLIQDLRRAMDKEQGKFQVAPKRVLLKAAKEVGFSLSLEELKEHIAIVCAHADPIGITKAVFDFAKANKKTLEVVGGAIDGKYHTAIEMKKISALPTPLQMRAQFVGLLQAPLRKFLGVQSAVMTGVIHCLKNKEKKASEGES